MILETIPQVQELDTDEKLLLVAELWDDLNAQKADFPVSAELAAELADREDEYRRDPESTVTTWSEAKQRIRESRNARGRSPAAGRS